MLKAKKNKKSNDLFKQKCLESLKKKYNQTQITFLKESLTLFCLLWFVAQVCKQRCDKNQETNKKVQKFHKKSSRKRGFGSNST